MLAKPASTSLLRTFWCVSCLLGIASVVAISLFCFLVVTRLRSTGNRTLSIRTSFCKGYLPLVLGDCILLSAFVPVDSAKALSVMASWSLVVGVEICHAIACLVVLGVCLSACGTSFAAFHIWRFFDRSIHLRADFTVNSWVVASFLGFCLVVGFSAFVVAFRNSLTGEFRQLNCSFLAFDDGRTGGILLFVLLANLAVTCGFFWSLLRRLNRVISSLSSPSSAKVFRVLAFKFIVAYVLTWGPFCVTMIAPLSGRQLPAVFDAVSLLIIKAKPLLDFLLIKSCTTFKPDIMPTIRRKSLKDLIITRFNTLKVRADSHLSGLKRARRTASQPALARLKRTRSQSSQITMPETTRVRPSRGLFKSSVSLPNVKVWRQSTEFLNQGGRGSAAVAFMPFDGSTSVRPSMTRRTVDFSSNPPVVFQAADV